VGRGANIGIGIGHLEDMLLNLAVFADMVQVSVVQVIDMVAVLNARVFAIGTVLMVVMSV